MQRRGQGAASGTGSARGVVQHPTFDPACPRAVALRPSARRCLPRTAGARRAASCGDRALDPVRHYRKHPGCGHVTSQIRDPRQTANGSDTGRLSVPSRRGDADRDTSAQTTRSLGHPLSCCPVTLPVIAVPARVATTAGICRRRTGRMDVCLAGSHMTHNMFPRLWVETINPLAVSSCRADGRGKTPPSGQCRQGTGGLMSCHDSVEALPSRHVQDMPAAGPHRRSAHPPERSRPQRERPTGPGSARSRRLSGAEGRTLAATDRRSA